jgi:hypothetical protein
MLSECLSDGYLPLKQAGQSGGEFRILALLPDCNGLDIQRAFQNAFFANPPYCEALSYTWANLKSKTHQVPVKIDLSKTYPVTLDDTQVRINYNLEAALYTFGYGAESGCLWVGALCINQAGLEERSEQVK